MSHQPPGRGGYSHTLPIRVCVAQRGRDFEAPDLERGIHSICNKGEVQQESNCTMMAKHVFIYLAVYTLVLQLTRGMVKILF